MRRYTASHTFPDVQIAVEDVIAEGDKIVARFTIRGTHQGLDGHFTDNFRSIAYLLQGKHAQGRHR
jgi:predicted ester cyclase